MENKVERYYRVDVTEGSRKQPAYFYETRGGLADIVYGWATHSSGMHRSISTAVEDFRRTLQAKHDAAGDRVAVMVSDPMEVSMDEVDRHSPRFGALAARARAILQEEMSKSAYPVEITAVEWEWIDAPNSPELVRLRLSDELGNVAAEFTPQELQDESLMRHRLRRLYDQLLDNRLGRFLERNLESIREHART